MSCGIVTQQLVSVVLPRRFPRFGEPRAGDPDVPAAPMGQGLSHRQGEPDRHAARSWTRPLTCPADSDRNLVMERTDGTLTKLRQMIASGDFNEEGRMPPERAL